MLRDPQCATIVRQAQESDHAALCRLWAEGDALHARLRPDFFRVAAGMPRSRRFLIQALAARQEVVLLAAVGDAPELAGLIHVRIYDTPVEPTKVPRTRGHVEEMVVAQACRRKGVGRELMQEAVRWCREQGASQLLLTVWAGNRPAEAFYADLGFQPVSQVLGLELTGEPVAASPPRR